MLFVNNLLFSAAIAAIVFLVLGGVDPWRRGSVTAMRVPAAPGTGDVGGAAHPGSGGGDVDLVVISAPQLSFFEMKRIAAALDGKKVAEGVRLLVTANSMVCRALQEHGLLEAITRAGGVVLQGTCWYIMDPAAQREQFGWKRLVTNSAKLVNIIRAHGYQPALRRTDVCIEAALSGKLEPR